MFEQMNEQLKSAMKPVSELASLNLNTFQQLAEKQSALYSSLVSEGMAYAEKATQQKDVTSFVEAQKAYFETLQTSVTDAAKDSYSVLTEAQQKAGELLKGMTVDFTPAAK